MAPPSSIGLDARTNLAEFNETNYYDESDELDEELDEEDPLLLLEEELSESESVSHFSTACL